MKKFNKKLGKGFSYYFLTQRRGRHLIDADIQDAIFYKDFGDKNYYLLSRRDERPNKFLKDEIIAKSCLHIKESSKC